MLNVLEDFGIKVNYVVFFYTLGIRSHQIQLTVIGKSGYSTLDKPLSIKLGKKILKLFGNEWLRFCYNKQPVNFKLIKCTRRQLRVNFQLFLFLVMKQVLG